MLWINRLRLRMRSLFRRNALEQELNREMEFHLAEQKAEYTSLGMPEGDAEAAARRAFGPVAALRDECRDRRGTRWLEDLLADARFAGRSFSKSPAFTLVVVLTLALGIGANAAFFSAAWGILFRPLPYPAPERLVDLENGIGGIGPVTALRDLARAVDYAGYIPEDDLIVQLDGQAWRARAAGASWNLSRVLGVGPGRGRWFAPREELQGQHRVAVLSDDMWRTRFSADPAILGRRMVVNDEPFTVIGVMPAGFAYPSPATEFWIPIRLDPRNPGYMWGGSNEWPVGRLRDGMTFGSAQAELGSAIDRIRNLFPWRMPDAWGVGARAIPSSEAAVKDVRVKLFALAIASFLLLMIACGNVANLLLARAVQREREFSMREALGARRGRLLRQVLTENLILVLAGGLAGGLAAALILKGLSRLLPKQTPRISEIVPDATLILAASGAMLLTILLFSAPPALRLLRSRGESLGGRAITPSKRSSGISLALIGVELALATALLIGAGLMGRTLWQLAAADSGFHATNVITAQVSAGPNRCSNRERCAELASALTGALLDVPGVRTVNWSNMAPLTKDFSAAAMDIQDHPRPAGAPAYVLWQVSATPGYFQALGIPLVAGRVFTDNDRDRSMPVTVISASTARRFWPHESAIGKRIRLVWNSDWRAVVGVVGDVAQYSLTGFPEWVDGASYLPLAQTLPQQAQTLQLTAFVESSRSLSAGDLRRAVQRSFPDVVLSRIASLQHIRSESVADQRSTAWLLALFAGLGLILGVAGVYGVISHRAAQRNREIGIRIALGASAARVVGMVLRETLIVAMAGTLAGVASAWALARYLESLLFGVTTHDAATLVLCPVLLLAAALLAAAVPGLRASRTDPALTLREE